MVSGNFPTQLSLITTCHSPGTGAFSLAQRPQETGWGSWAHMVTQTWDQPVFDNLWVPQVLTSPCSGPTPGHRVPSVADVLPWVAWIAPQQEMANSSHFTCQLLEVATRSFVLIILKFYPDLAEKISRLIVDVCHAEVKGKLYRLR